jgi:hypothetical protein
LTNAESARLIKACLSHYPPPSPTGRVVDRHDYCECLDAFVENELSPEEYHVLVSEKQRSAELQSKLAEIRNTCVAAAAIVPDK